MPLVKRKSPIKAAKLANLIWWYLDQASSKQNGEKQKHSRLDSKHVVKYLKDGNIINKKLYSYFWIYCNKNSEWGVIWRKKYCFARWWIKLGVLITYPHHHISRRFSTWDSSLICHIRPGALADPVINMQILALLEIYDITINRYPNRWRLRMKNKYNLQLELYCCKTPIDWFPENINWTPSRTPSYFHFPCENGIFQSIYININIFNVGALAKREAK